ncbi:hypothetical protein L596_018047 [Steinernema carpocapsae]|uniref:Uncharacterized protein n=1 Tax=Steinernema carpocapsae TaxID=34508 RepID=A0A4U5N484_STECR|nr:hypothetical protein L596_018047 [Steinernema carpocapsae]
MPRAVVLWRSSTPVITPRRPRSSIHKSRLAFDNSTSSRRFSVSNRSGNFSRSPRLSKSSCISASAAKRIDEDPIYHTSFSIPILAKVNEANRPKKSRRSSRKVSKEPKPKTTTSRSDSLSSRSRSLSSSRQAKKSDRSSRSSKKTSRPDAPKARKTTKAAETSKASRSIRTALSMRSSTAKPKTAKPRTASKKATLRKRDPATGRFVKA